MTAATPKPSIPIRRSTRAEEGALATASAEDKAKGLEPARSQPPTPAAKARLAKVGGSPTSAEFNGTMLVYTVAAHGIGGSEDPEQLDRIVSTAMAAFKPQDEIEGMLAAQAVAMHFAAMGCFVASHGVPPDIASRYRRDGANLARAMTEMLTALDEKRGKRRRQVVRVEKVTVEAGAQAIVGNVHGGPAGEAKGSPEAVDGGDWPADA